MDFINYINSIKSNDIKLYDSFDSDIEYIYNEIKNNNISSESNINSGIGDILLYKNYCVKHKRNNKIYWNINHLLEYKPFPDNIQNIKFNIELFHILFDKDNVVIFFN